MIFDFKGHKFVHVFCRSNYYIDWKAYECSNCKCIVVAHKNYYIFTNGTLDKTNTANPKHLPLLKTELSCDEYIIKNIIE